jgi:DNA repair exonuclease SbcCD ATPase subunit
MNGVSEIDILRVAFAVSLLLAAVSVAGAALDRISQRVVYGFATVVGAGALAGWLLFALDPRTALAVPAGGLTASLLAAVAAIGVRRATLHGRRIEAEIARAEARLATVVARGGDERSAELERVLARARAESLSLIADEERRIVESRRAAIAEREQVAAHELNKALAETQRRVEQRLAAWSGDLERAQANMFDQLQTLAGRQRRLIQEAEERLAADAERLESESEVQRSAFAKLREEIERATEQSVANARAELETHTVERRQALHELNERLRLRERELRDALEREQTEALQSIQAAFTDVERRLVERLERVVERTTSQHADAAALQFTDAIKRSREDSAKRLSRELERAVESFAHQAEGMMSERVENVGQTAAQRFDRRLADAEAAIDARRDEVVASVEQRLATAEQEMRQRLEELAADGEAERGVLEARLFELQRRLDAAHAHAQALDS